MKKTLITSILCLWGLFFCYEITYAKPDGIFTKVQNWWNDGWQYVCEVKCSSCGICKLYTKTINGNIAYMVKDHDKNEHLAEHNSSFGKRTEKVYAHSKADGEYYRIEKNPVYSYKYYASFVGYFNIPGEDIAKELASIQAKEWQFVKVISLYKTEERQSCTARIRYDGNLYKREIDGKYMVIPCGTYSSFTKGGTSLNVYYNKDLQRDMCYEPKNPRKIIIKEKSHTIAYQNECYVLAPMIVEWYTHKADEYSLNLW